MGTSSLKQHKKGGILMKFKDQVVVVTGGAKGMGGGCVDKFASEGAKVVIVDIDEKEGIRSATKLTSEGKDVLFVKTDVSIPSDVEKMVIKAIEKFGKINHLVNSAGIQRYGSTVDTPEEVWDQVLDINVKSIFLTSKYAIPHMQKNGGGAIVNISSVQAFASQKGVAAYSASKGAINALTRAMAIDYANDQIRVTAVCPGSVDTPMLRWAADLFKGDKTVEDVLHQWGKSHPLGRVATIEDIAEFVSFLCSEQGKFITGSTHMIDGGLMSQIPVVIPE
jgi:NAD(P)-dependent dehydrogenase (short-subunit alcohol dehydrogenase family)